MNKSRHIFFTTKESGLIIFLFLLFSLINSSKSQNQLQGIIGGSGGEVAWSILQTPDGGYTLAGTTNSFGAGNDDVYIVKLDINGVIQWSRTIGGIKNDGCSCIIRTSDGGYIAAGATLSYGAGFYDCFIIKLDVYGMLQWSKTIGGHMFEEAVSIIETSDGGYAVAGSTTSSGAGTYDMFVFKLNGIGSLQWCISIGSGGPDAGKSIVQTSDGGYVIGGTYLDHYCIIKLNPNGIIQWSKISSGGGFNTSLILTSDGGFAMTGYSSNYGAGNADIYVIKLDSAGTLQWSKAFGGPAVDQGASIIQTTDGGYAVSGLTNSFGAANYNACLVKIDIGGMLQWCKTMGGNGAEYGWALTGTSDGGYAITGETVSFGPSNDIYFAKLDVNGNTCGYSVAPVVMESAGGDVTTISLTTGTPNVTVLSPNPFTATGGNATSICFLGNPNISNEMPLSFELFQNFPNPFNPSTQIGFSIPKNNSQVKLTVFDASGKEISTLVNSKFNAGNYKVDFSGNNISSGIYFYKLDADEFTEVKKMVFLK